MTPLCRQHDSLLLCIDIQDRLFAAMPKPSRQRVLDNTETLITAAKLLDIPMIYTEQYPVGLGNTVAQIKDILPEAAQYFDKTQFSCCGSDELMKVIRSSHKRQIIITGMEAHICVMQTAIELRAEGYEVFVADDAICSQRRAHWKSALHRLHQANVTATPTESILFEWLRDSSHEHFKAISALLD